MIELSAQEKNGSEHCMNSNIICNSFKFKSKCSTNHVLCELVQRADLWVTDDVWLPDGLHC